MTDIKYGLTQEEVQKRRSLGQDNHLIEYKTKSVKQILIDNLCTFFNMINFILGLFILTTGSYKNLLFLGVIVCNIIIGIAVELRAKRSLDKINLITRTKVFVQREGKKQECYPEDLVLGDILYLTTGNQIVVDGQVVDGHLEVNEALLTGESDTVIKNVGDTVYSGSYVVASSALIEVTAVAEQTYANQLGKEAKEYKKHPSQLRETLNLILKTVSLFIIPVGLLMLGKSLVFNHLPWNDAILKTAAALIGMIPEGLFLLCSISLTVGVIKLINKKTLVQEMFCIESMARIDTLCLDKTGTITQGKMQVHEVKWYVDQKISSRIGNLLHELNETNFTAQALKAYFTENDQATPSELYYFTSANKYSGAKYSDGVYRIGSYPHIVEHPDEQITKEIEALASCGYRVLTVVKTVNDHHEVLALITLIDPIRENAPQIFDYFLNQGVDLKVISGDHPQTVAHIAKQAGLKNADRFVDMSQYPDDHLDGLVNEYTVFGRVSPKQKKSLIQALKKQGHFVAMMGDGINDVPAMKESNCSITVNNGSEITKSIADILLLNSDFSSLPAALLEGRRVINNIQRVSTLFLTKTVYSILIAFIVLLTPLRYPFVPIQMTLINLFTIGLPGFFLAIEPSRERIKGNFLTEVSKIAIPAGFSVIGCLLIGLMIPSLHRNHALFDTYCFCIAMVSGFWVLIRSCLPINLKKIAILFISITGITLSVLKFSNLFMLSHVTPIQLIQWVLLIVPLYALLFFVLKHMFHQILSKLNIQSN